MADTEEKWFSSWLENRQFEECPPNLADKIIARSQAIEQKGFAVMVYCIRSSFRDLMMPRPYQTMASILLAGFIAGFITWHSPAAPDQTETQAPMIQAFLYEEGL